MQRDGSQHNNNSIARGPASNAINTLGILETIIGYTC